MGVRLQVWGDYACFTRPEMKVERMSYDVITPSAARGILEAVYWHPGMRWIVDRIHVMNPIRFTSVRRNEVDSKIIAKNVCSYVNNGGDAPAIYTADDRQQRAATILMDVSYVIDAHFAMTRKASPEDSPAKFQSIFNRRAEKGQCYHHPYFGCREFPVNFKPIGADESVATFEKGTRDLGFMLYDMDFSNPQDIRPMFFRATLTNGVLDLTGLDREELHS